MSLVITYSSPPSIRLTSHRTNKEPSSEEAKANKGGKTGQRVRELCWHGKYPHEQDTIVTHNKKLFEKETEWIIAFNSIDTLWLKGNYETKKAG